MKGRALYLKKHILIGFLFIILLTIVFGCEPSPISYDHIKSQTVEFFKSHQNSFEDVKNTVLRNQSAANVSIKKIRSIKFEIVDTSQKITFEYGTYGDMDAKWWGIYYSSDDKPRPDGRFLADDSIELIEATTEGCYFLQDSDGNIWYATERISKNWFFYFSDEATSIYDPHWSAK